jgi:hypothetical protein
LLLPLPILLLPLSLAAILPLAAFSLVITLLRLYKLYII